MKTYRISAEKARVETPLALQRAVYLGLIAVLVGVFIGGRSMFVERAPNFPWWWFSMLGLFVVAFVFYSIWKTKKFLVEAYSSYELNVDADSYTKKQKNTPTVTLLRSEIKQVREFQGKGFRICTADHSRNIWVPCELEDYEQLKAELLSLPIEVHSEQRSWLRSYLATALLLLLFVIQALFPNRFVAAGAAFLIAAGLFVFFYRHRDNPNLTSAGKRQVWLSLLVAIAMVGRGILLLG